MTGHRLPTQAKHLKNRAMVTFTFDGSSYQGFEGEPLSAALTANGVRILGRSFKYHRPRGLMAAGIEEPNALVTVLDGDQREPNVAATMVTLREGLKVISQNRGFNVKLDPMAINQLAGPALSAGFYYKTFMAPAIGPLKGTKFWMFCEKIIRRAAGLGEAGYAPDPAHYDRMNGFCDLLIVGGGIAGLTAACEAAEKGKRIIVADLNTDLGGALLWSGAEIEGMSARSYAQSLIEELTSNPNVTLLNRTTIWGYYDGNTLAGVERIAEHKAPDIGEPRQRHWTIRASKVILATGALERPLIFAGNDRPGVMLADAIARMVFQQGVTPGKTLAFVTNNDSVYQTAIRLVEAGISVAAIIDLRTNVDETLLTQARDNNIEVHPAHGIATTKGLGSLKAITIQPVAPDGEMSGAQRTIACDVLGMSGGYSPLIHLASQAGDAPIFDKEYQAFMPPEAKQNWAAIGACKGATTLQAAAGKALDISSDDRDAKPSPILEMRNAKAKKAFVDFQHDVTASDIRLANREGFHSIEHLKRYTTLGMATDQGKTSNITGLSIMAAERGISMGQAGTTRFRAPFTGVSLGAISGESYGHVQHIRRTPMHDWHESHNARMIAAGLWMRPMIYGHAGESIEQAYIREAKNVRTTCGLVDVSTLGKIAVQGPDAGAFLDRVYTNMFSTLKVGKARYGLMLREDGFAKDDGTTWRLSECEYLMTTTTANAGPVMQHLEYCLECLWPDLKVHVTTVSDQWAAMALAGPNARTVLADCVEGTPVDHETLPPMGIVDGTIDGVSVKICRLSFSGERAYEIYCASGFGTQVWHSLMQAGKAHGIAPYGLEALGTLRIEKGHVTGAEIDGRTTARDLHLDWILSKKKPFIGSMMMDREAMQDDQRLRLVGIKSLNGQKLTGGAHIVRNAQPKETMQSLGHVTAMCYSPALGYYIGLALVQNGTQKIGQKFYQTDPLRDKHIPIEIISHHMFDKEGTRQNG